MVKIVFSHLIVLKEISDHECLNPKGVSVNGSCGWDNSTYDTIGMPTGRSDYTGVK